MLPDCCPPIDPKVGAPLLAAAPIAPKDDTLLAAAPPKMDVAVPDPKAGVPPNAVAVPNAGVDPNAGAVPNAGAAPKAVAVLEVPAGDPPKAGAAPNE